MLLVGEFGVHEANKVPNFFFRDIDVRTGSERFHFRALATFFDDPEQLSIRSLFHVTCHGKIGRLDFDILGGRTLAIAIGAVTLLAFTLVAPPIPGLTQCVKPDFGCFFLAS